MLWLAAILIKESWREFAMAFAGAGASEIGRSLRSLTPRHF